MSTTYIPITPEEPHEEEIVIPLDVDIHIVITAIEEDEDCDPSTQEPFDFSGSTVVLEVFEHSSDDVPVFTQPDSDWTITQNSDGATAGKNNQLKTTLDYTDLEGVPLDLLREYWFRVHVTDASGSPYTLWRGPFILDNK